MYRDRGATLKVGEGGGGGGQVTSDSKPGGGLKTVSLSNRLYIFQKSGGGGVGGGLKHPQPLPLRGPWCTCFKNYKFKYNRKQELVEV